MPATCVVSRFDLPECFKTKTKALNSLKELLVTACNEECKRKSLKAADKKNENEPTTFTRLSGGVL